MDIFPLSKFIFPVEQTHILMFARAVGEEPAPYTAAIFADDEEAASAIAPPTFVQAAAQFDPEFPLRPRQGEKWLGSGRSPCGLDEPPVSSGRLHAEQHFEYIRPIRAGDVLSVESKVGARWEKESRRGGNLIFEETVTEFRDQHGDLVCISRRIVMEVQKKIVAGNPPD